MPKIGIRPVIDGRRQGVRESLERQTMAMAKATAALLTKNLRHHSGLAVECVIAESCIGGVAEAAQAAVLFQREGVGVSLSLTPCWCYGSETMDMDPHMPKAIYGLNGTERPGAVYLAATMAAHNQKGLTPRTPTRLRSATWNDAEPWLTCDVDSHPAGATPEGVRDVMGYRCRAGLTRHACLETDTP